MMEYIGFGLAVVGFLMGITGSWYISHDSNKSRRRGFGIWICGNPINAIVLIGVILNLWTGLPLVFMLTSTMYYWATAYRGWKNNDC